MKSNIGWMLSRVAFSWRTTVDRYMAEIGLTQSRWIALLHLDRLGEGCTQTELAANIGIEQPSLFRTLQQLEEAGLIERRSCADDARRRTLWFTASGRDLLRDVDRLVLKGRRQLLKGLSTEQRQTFYDLLSTVLDNAHNIPETDKNDR